MNYKKITKTGYHLHVIQTNRFKTVHMVMNFKRPIEKKEITLRNMLADIVLNSSEKYLTLKDIIIETEELYNFGAGSSAYKSGNYDIISWKCRFLNEKYTETGMTEKSIEFFTDLIFHPNVKNKKFDSESFEYTKDCLQTALESVKDNPGAYSNIRMKEYMDPNSPNSYRTDGYLEDLDLINEENLYEYYQDVLKNDVVDIFVLGDVEITEIEKLVDKYILLNRKQPQYNLSHQVENEGIRKEISTIVEKEDFNQSKLAIGIKLYDLTREERMYTLYVLTFILGGSGDSKLFSKLRGENSLCYYVSASSAALYDQIHISSGIDKKEFRKAVSLIEEVIESIKQGEIDDEEIEKAINTYISGCQLNYDSPSSLIGNYMSHEYHNIDLIEERMEKIKQVTQDKVIALANKINIDTVYLLEGGEIDEEKTSE